MSIVANKRALAEATHALIHASQPDLPHFEAVGKALAQVVTDAIGVGCEVVLRMDAKAIAALVADMEGKTNG